jgi:RNA polymerase sigma-70 factor, ECF subfamily
MSYSEDMNKWVLLSLEGERDAFLKIYDETITDATKLVNILIYDKTQKEDILQDIYLELYKSLSKFKMEEQFRPWFTGIVIRQTKSYLRKNWLLSRVKSKQMEHLVPEDEADFSDHLVDQLHNQELLHIIDSLSFKLKSIIVLRYLSDFSQEEIANILKLPIGTVRSRISYGLKILRKKLKIDRVHSEKRVNKFGF